MAYTPVWALHHIGSDAGKMLIVELECEERHTEPLPQFGHVMQMLRSHGRHHLVSASPTALTRLHGLVRREAWREAWRCPGRLWGCGGAHLAR